MSEPNWTSKTFRSASVPKLAPDVEEEPVDIEVRRTKLRLTNHLRQALLEAHALEEDFLINYLRNSLNQVKGWLEVE